MSKEDTMQDSGKSFDPFTTVSDTLNKIVPVSSHPLIVNGVFSPQVTPTINSSVTQSPFNDMQIAEITRMITQQLAINAKTCVLTCKEYKVLQVTDTNGKSKSFLYERDVVHTMMNGFITSTYNDNSWNLVKRKEVTIMDDVTTYIPLSNAGLL